MTLNDFLIAIIWCPQGKLQVGFKHSVELSCEYPV